MIGGLAPKASIRSNSTDDVRHEIIGYSGQSCCIVGGVRKPRSKANTPRRKPTRARRKQTGVRMKRTTTTHLIQRSFFREALGESLWEGKHLGGRAVVSRPHLCFGGAVGVRKHFQRPAETTARQAEGSAMSSSSPKLTQKGSTKLPTKLPIEERCSRNEGRSRNHAT